MRAEFRGWRDSSSQKNSAAAVEVAVVKCFTAGVAGARLPVLAIGALLVAPLERRIESSVSAWQGMALALIIVFAKETIYLLYNPAAFDSMCSIPAAVPLQTDALRSFLPLLRLCP